MNATVGFSSEGLGFLRTLAANNDRDWFNAHKADYKAQVEGPAKHFAASVAAGLTAMTGDALSHKVFRIYRDVRFSKDKTPYNTHVRIGWFAEGAGAIKRGFFFSLETDKTVFGAGSMDFGKEGLEIYRKAIIDEAKGAAVVSLLSKLGKGGASLHDAELKRVPREYDADHPRAALRRRKSLAAWLESGPEDFVQANDGPATALSSFERLMPLYDWLRDLA